MNNTSVEIMANIWDLIGNIAFYALIIVFIILLISPDFVTKSQKLKQGQTIDDLKKKNRILGAIGIIILLFIHFA